MFKKILLGDIKRSKGISLTLTFLLALAATLVVTGAGLISHTFAAVDSLWRAADPPDVVQMHAGDLAATGQDAKVQQWAASQSTIEDVRLVRTLPVPGAQLWLAGVNQAESVLEPAFVEPSERFDLLVDAHGTTVHPNPGEISMPVHYLATGQLALGDTVTVRTAAGDKHFTVTSFARDVQMNPSMVTSKRMVVNPADFEELNALFTQPEYLIEFKLKDGTSTSVVQDTYADAGLPRDGIAVDASVFRLFNALSTLLTAVLAIVIAVLLVGISALALRFAFLAAIEADLVEIGTLKAIGAPPRRIKNMYLAKYVALSATGSLIGTLAAIPITWASLKPVTLYLGSVTPSPATLAPPVLAALLVPCLISLFCWVLLRRIDKLSATQTLRRGTTHSAGKIRLRLSRSRLPVHQWLGITGALRANNLLLVGVIMVSTFLMILPAALVSTINNPEFATYLGIGRSDVRIDVRDPDADFTGIASRAAADTDVEKSVALTSHRYDINTGERWESVVVERGDHTVFPLNYLSGHAPTTDTEIALSANQAQELGSSLGDQITLRTDSGERTLTVSGTYQDITNGGKTAKVHFEDPASTPVWQVIYLTLADGIDAKTKAAELSAALPDAKVNAVSDYSVQTFGATAAQLGIVATLAAVVGCALVFLLTLMFLILLLGREQAQRDTLRALGASGRGLASQYFTRIGIVGILGVGLGILAVSTLGNTLFHTALGALGAPGVQLLPNPLISWLALPALLLAVIAAATAIPTRSLYAR